tara:strand:+ start:882 stop:1991 length:1110 start_codon:yes stop_codon:yes gene_type:complete
MKKKLSLKVKLGKSSYPIFIGNNLFQDLENLIPNFNGFSKIILITDKIIYKNHYKIIDRSFAKNTKNFQKIIVPAGEKTKSFIFLEDLIEKILKIKIDRNALLICFGGGVIGDLVGLTASLLLRGIEFVQIPSTLLAQVDSSVGGKTGINSRQGKNLIGTFKQPISVIISIEILKTLPKREIISGYAEILKYSLINDKSFFYWLQKNGKKVISLNYESCLYAISNSCQIKSKIVSEDEKEQGIREILNFGHTFGHAIESFTYYSRKINHGEAVYLGMYLALRFSLYLGICKRDLIENFVSHLEELDISYKIKDYNLKITPRKFVEHIKYDKKIKNKKLKFILLQEFGRPFRYILDNEKILMNFFKEELT